VISVLVMLISLIANDCDNTIEDHLGEFKDSELAFWLYKENANDYHLTCKEMGVEKGYERFVKTKVVTEKTGL